MDSESQLTFIQIDSELMQNSMSKDILAQHLEKTARKFNAVAALLCLTVYSATAKSEKEAKEMCRGRLSERPGSVESLFIEEMIGSTVRVHFAPIIRSAESAPTLGE